MKNTRVGVVLVFKSGVTFEQANDLLNEMKILMEVNGVKKYVSPIDHFHSVVDAFNPDHGYPMFYIP